MSTRPPKPPIASPTHSLGAHITTANNYITIIHYHLTYIESVESSDVVDELGVDGNEVIETHCICVSVPLDLAWSVHPCVSIS